MLLWIKLVKGKLFFNKNQVLVKFVFMNFALIQSQGTSSLVYFTVQIDHQFYTTQEQPNRVSNRPYIGL